MNSSCSSQKKIRKALRSYHVMQNPTIKRALGDDVEPKKPSSRVKHDKFVKVGGGKPKKSSRVEHDKFKNVDNGHGKSKIKKLKSKMYDRVKPTTHSKKHLASDELSELENSFSSNGNNVDDDLLDMGQRIERELQNQDQQKEVNQFNAVDMEEDQDEDQEEDKEEDKKEDKEEDKEKDQDEDQEEDKETDQEKGQGQGEVNQFETEDGQEGQNFENNEVDTDTESLSVNCLEGVLKGFNKDIGALYTKTNSIECDIKEIKKLLKTRPTKHCSFQSLSSKFKENSACSLLPKLPLLKKSHVRKMDYDSEDNEEYKLQMINKLASYGGKSVQDLMINIFRKLFSFKLKTKYCWRGSPKGKGKAAFRNLKNVIEILWSAVKVHFEDCTEAMVIKEIKLRLNQAEKDYEREMAKTK